VHQKYDRVGERVAGNGDAYTCALRGLQQAQSQPVVLSGMTLENSKGYRLEQRQQSLLDVSRQKLDTGTPHQVGAAVSVRKRQRAH